MPELEDPVVVVLARPLDDLHALAGDLDLPILGIGVGVVLAQGVEAILVGLHDLTREVLDDLASGMSDCWRSGSAAPTEIPIPPALVGVQVPLQLSDLICRMPVETHVITPEWTDAAERLCSHAPPGSRALRLWRQVEAEARMACDDVDGALRAVGQSVEHGLRDLAWMRRCPLLAPVRDEPRFVALTNIVDARVVPRIIAYREGAQAFTLPT